MSQKSIRNALIAFAIIFLLSRTGKILEFLSELDPGGILTLAPLRDSPEEARFFVTIALCALIFTVIFCQLNRRK